ncbi:unnamed protein product [Paramecium sonneborni]|uniref:Uncharacterized protein n=1 Tax=Paramecium sonneborni TaxID=65129 RepID=A0A8S1NKX8_9CILI|nr:unnamed protein product [Paramecium sonneborni]
MTFDFQEAKKRDVRLNENSNLLFTKIFIDNSQKLIKWFGIEKKQKRDYLQLNENSQFQVGNQFIYFITNILIDRESDVLLMSKDSIKIIVFKQLETIDYFMVKMKQIIVQKSENNKSQFRTNLRCLVYTRFSSAKSNKELISIIERSQLNYLSINKLMEYLMSNFNQEFQDPDILYSQGNQEILNVIDNQMLNELLVIEKKSKKVKYRQINQQLVIISNYFTNEIILVKRLRVMQNRQNHINNIYAQEILQIYKKISPN